MTPDELRAIAEYLLRVRDARHESHRIAVEHGWKFAADELPEDWTEGEELARAWIAEHPHDGHLSVDADWLLAVGGEKVEDTRKPFDEAGECGTWPKVKYGPFVWYTNLWVSNGDGTYTPTYFLKYGGVCLGSSPELTRDKFRHLCRGLGVEAPA
jgi:hypothetical protein